jgi:hypothetical protein
MPLRWRLLFYLELVVCFGPILAILCVGFFMIPIWASMFALQLWDIPFNTGIEEAPLWITIPPLGMAIGGTVALPSLFRAVSSITDGRDYLQAHKRTRVFLVVGLLALILGVPYLLAAGAKGLALVGLLPLACLWHIFAMLKRRNLMDVHAA